MYLHTLHRRLLAEELVRLRRADEHQRYAAAQRRGRIDPNPHQIDAVVFALQRIRETSTLDSGAARSACEEAMEALSRVAETSDVTREQLTAAEAACEDREHELRSCEAAWQSCGANSHS